MSAHILKRTAAITVAALAITGTAQAQPNIYDWGNFDCSQSISSENISSHHHHTINAWVIGYYKGLSRGEATKEARADIIKVTSMWCEAHPEHTLREAVTTAWTLYEEGER